MLDKMNELYQQMIQNYEGGLSNTSTKKFDGIVSSIAKMLEIPENEVYATGSGSRPGNLEVRLSQGVRATIHTTVGLGFIVDEKNTPENVTKLTNSALATCKKFLGRGKARYDNIVILVESNGTIEASGIICQKRTSITDKLIKELNIVNIQEISVSTENNIFSGAFHSYRNCLSALRTKPFMLLAGISGTGKSRIVREFAFKSCPEYLQDKDGTTPGNYCMIEVKPNWHDSTELLGYYSRLGNDPGYQFTKFVKFLVKAKIHPNVPFFVCLDEMNLAPVEQYFAEMLSILETRKHPKNTETGEVDMATIKTGIIIDAQYFKGLSEYVNLSDKDIYMKLNDWNTTEEVQSVVVDEETGSRYDLTTEGLTLPDNVIIIGTVNMDDTTHHFSRKVIDRAMTIEMNGGNLRNMFGGSKNLEYLPKEEQEKWQNAFTCRYVTADEVLEAHPEVADKLVKELPDRLEEINKALKGTPFEVSYRVLNELTIMVGVMLDENEDKELDDIINQAINNILLMKILPRIEGDAEMFAMSREYKAKMDVTYENRLEWLKALAPNIQDEANDTSSEENDDVKSTKEHQQTANEKIQEMIDRLNNQEFTRFWP